MRVIDLLNKYNLNDDYSKRVMQYVGIINTNADKIMDYLNIDKSLSEEERVSQLSQYLQTCQETSPLYDESNFMKLARYSAYEIDDNQRYIAEDMSGYDFDASQYDDEDLTKMGYRR